MKKNACWKCVVAAGIACVSLMTCAADTWHWLGNYSVKALTGSGYGYARNFATNWQNAATGAYGIPANGDFIVVDRSSGSFGSDFTVNNVFGGLVYETTPNAGSDQATITLQAGGPGIVVQPNVKLAAGARGSTSEVWLNGSVAFVGSGDAILDVRSCHETRYMLYVQKSLYGNADITLVKRGMGTVANSEGYADNQARSATDGYYANRKFAFGGVKLQQGVLAMRQYYWVHDCDFQFDGEGVGLYLGTFNGNKRQVSYYSLVLNGGRFRETANAAGAAHYVEGQDATCGLQFVGTQEDTSFSGAFKGGAGIIWQPSNAATFSFRRSVSPTVGIVVVSNGTVRVTDGAGLPNVSAITVSGAGATFRVDATARAGFPASALEIADGGTLSLADGVTMTVASAMVDGAAVAAGLYHGAGAASVNGSTLANWIDGAAYVRVGAMDGDEVSVTSGTTTVGGANQSLLLTADQTWDVGSGALTVAGEVTPVGNAALKIVGSGGTLNLNAGTAGWVNPLVISNVQVKINGPQTFGAGESPVYIYHAGSGKSPILADGATVDRDLWLVDTSAAKSGTTSFSIPENATVTFNGYLQATNTAAINVTAGAGSRVVFNKLFHSRNGSTLSGNGTIVFKGPMHIRDRGNITSSPIIELWATGNRLSGNMGTFNGGTLKAMVPYAVNKVNTQRQTTDIDTNNSSDGSQNTMMNAANSFTFDLCGNDQSIDQMGMYRGGGHVCSETPATFHLMTANSDWPSHNVNQGGTYASNNSSGYERQDKGWWEGAVNLSYEAAAATKCRFMMRQSPSTGRVDVVGGTLVFTRRAATSGETFDLKRGTGTASMATRLSNEDGGWTNAAAVAVHKGGTLVFEHGNAIGPQTDVYLYTGATLEIDAGVLQKCHDLYVDDMKMTQGRVYGSAGQNVNGADGSSLFAGGGGLYARGNGQGLTIILH